MHQFCYSFPVLPGKGSKLKDLTKALNGPKRREFDQAQKRSKTRREVWFLWQTPQGTMVSGYFESEMAPDKAMEMYAKSKDPFDVWFKDQIKDISGFDMSSPPPGPPPEQILAYGY